MNIELTDDFHFPSTDPAELSDWIPAGVNPVHDGRYRVANKNVCEMSKKYGRAQPFGWTVMEWRNGQWQRAERDDGDSILSALWAFYPPSIIGAWQGRSKP